MHILAFDAGTTSVRAILFASDGQPVAAAQREIAQYYPEPGWVEHDPLQVLTTQAEVAIECLARAGVTKDQVAGIGLTNQRETTILWDRSSGEPLHRAIVWQDRRTAGHCDRLLADGAGPMITERTGLLLDAYFSATKIAWLLDHVPGARASAEAGELACGTVDAWLLDRLCGRHVTDPSNASRTMLYNLHAGTWDDELCALFGVPAAMLPEVRSSSEIYGTLRGVPELEGLPIAGIAGDQQAALFGQLCVEPGLAKNTYGTGCFLLQSTGDRPAVSRHRLISTVAWELDGRRSYALEGSVFVGGAVVQWLRDELKLAPTSAGISDLAATVPESGGVVLVPAFVGLGAPHWDPHARGTICGLTRDTTAAHLARAALESIALQVADLVDAMAADTGRRLDELRVDGGASASDPLLQCQADLLGLPVVRPQVTETTALGAAYLAGLATGVWRPGADLTNQRSIDRTFEPSLPPDAVATIRARWRAALERAAGWCNAPGVRY